MLLSDKSLNNRSIVTRARAPRNSARSDTCPRPTARAQVRSLHSRCKDQILGTGGTAALQPLPHTPVHPPRGISKEAYRAVHDRLHRRGPGTNETVVKYEGVYPACWGDVRPTLAWQEELFRAETADHDSPSGRGGEHMIVNVWRPIQVPLMLCAFT